MRIATSTRQVTLSAPSRLHFGLFGCGRDVPAPYGGVGAMIESPRLEIAVSSHQRFCVEGPLAKRIRELTQRWLRFKGQAAPSGQRLPCRIVVRQPVGRHIGLGTGTQLALGVATALDAFFQAGEAPGSPPGAPPRLVSALRMADSLGRGGRSAIGCAGFVSGGLIVDWGTWNDVDPSARILRLTVPPSWKLLVAKPPYLRGRSGTAEADAFTMLPSVAESRRREMVQVVTDQMIPAIQRGDFAAFSQSVFAFGCLSGQCFESIQGGRFHGPVVARLVNDLRSQGLVGVGQSSWGPCVFAWIDDDNLALRVRNSIRRRWTDGTEVWTSAVDNNGAQVVTHTAG